MGWINYFPLLIGVLASGITFYFYGNILTFLATTVPVLYDFAVWAWGAWQQIGFSFLAGVAAALISYLAMREESALTTHGSAAWATKAELQEFLEGEGVALGRFRGELLRVQTHIVTCAPTRSGKGIGGIIPALLTHKGSLVCLDLKGENYAVTARRRGELRSKVVLLDPFSLTGQKASCFNILEDIDINCSSCIDKSALISSMLSTGDTDDHWTVQAETLIQGIILFVCATAKHDQPYKNMTEVRKLLTSDLSKVFDDMADVEPAFGIIGKIGRQFKETPEKERGSIISTAQKLTRFLDHPGVAESISKSDFIISDLKRKNISIFIAIPQKDLTSYRSYIRCLFALSLNAITSDNKKPEFGKVLFILDEFAQLGYMQCFEDAVGYAAGFGVQMCFYLQDLSQLEAAYKKWPSFLANSTRLFYGCADLKTAKYVSEMLGKYTQVVYTKKVGKEKKDQSYISRDLMTHSEVLSLPPTEPIVLIQGKKPVKLKRINYLTDAEYRGMFDSNPYH